MSKRAFETLDVENDYCYTYEGISFSSDENGNALERRAGLLSNIVNDIKLDTVSLLGTNSEPQVEQQPIEQDDYVFQYEYPKALPSDWIQINNLDERKVRRNEAIDRRFLSMINSLIRSLM